jgi:hypothetical protein
MVVLQRVLAQLAGVVVAVAVAPVQLVETVLAIALKGRAKYLELVAQAQLMTLLAHPRHMPVAVAVVATVLAL